MIRFYRTHTQTASEIWELALSVSWLMWEHLYDPAGYATYSTDTTSEDRTRSVCCLATSLTSYKHLNVQGSVLCHRDKTVYQKWLCQVLFSIRSEQTKGKLPMLTGMTWFKVKAKGFLWMVQGAGKHPPPALGFSTDRLALPPGYWHKTPAFSLDDERGETHIHTYLTQLWWLCNDTM